MGHLCGEKGAEKRAECLISEVVVTGEAVGHLIIFAGEPLGEDNGQVVDQ